MQKIVNVDVWFDKLAFQPAQAIFGIASGKTTGRGLGLGYPEVIPIADSEYVSAALGEEDTRQSKFSFVVGCSFCACDACPARRLFG